METVKLASIYEHIARLQPGSVAMVTQKLPERKVRVDGYDEIHRDLRPREELFKTQLLQMGIRHVPFSDPELAARMKELTAKRAFDLCVVTGEPFYQLLSIAAKIRKGRFKAPIFLEITEEEAMKETSRKAAEGNAKRWNVDDLLRNFVYLTKAKKSPTELPFEISSPLAAPPPVRSKVLKKRNPAPVATEEEPTDLAEPPGRFKAEVSRVIRDTKSARKLKALYECKCQVCGDRIQIPNGTFYAEVHHLRPLGGEHVGLDILSNMLVLCPNHHAMFDFRIPRFVSEDVVEINGVTFSLARKHRIATSSIEYHNSLVAGDALPGRPPS